jgi:hypothetical protein
MESTDERQYQPRLAYSLGLLTDLDYNQLKKDSWCAVPARHELKASRVQTAYLAMHF